jgi:hypothetical protein
LSHLFLSVIISITIVNIRRKSYVSAKPAHIFYCYCCRFSRYGALCQLMGGGYDNRLLAYPPPPTSAYPGPSGPSQPSPTSVSFPITPFIFHPETVCIPTPDPNNENNIPLPCGPTPTATFTPGTTNTPSPTASPTHTPTPLTPVWATPTHNPYNGTPFPTVTGTPGTPFPRQGVAPAMGGRSQAVNNRPNFSSWQYYWSAGVPLPHQHPGLHGNLIIILNML